MSKILDHRFGAKRVAYDPSDPEANKLAVSKGYTVVPGRSLTKGQWANVKQSSLILPAGQVTPSPSVASSPNGVPPVSPTKWTQEMSEVADFATWLWRHVGDGSISITWYDNRGLSFSGAWGDRSLSLNKAHLGRALAEWRTDGNTRKITRLLVHEFAHAKSGDHLSEEYHEELCRLAAEMLCLPTWVCG